MISNQKPNAAPDIFRIGEIEYYAESNCLIGACGKERKLRPQSQQVLRYLVENLGTLVHRNEIIEAVWHNIAVTDDSLTQCIADIRKAIGDHDRRVLITVPKQGYILNGETVGYHNDSLPDRPNVKSHLPITFFGSVAVAIRGLSESPRSLIKRLPVGIRPSAVVEHDRSTVCLVYNDPTESLNAALLIANSERLSVAVDYTEGDGMEAVALLPSAQAGEVMASQAISIIASRLADIEIADRGDVLSSSGQGVDRSFRISPRKHRHPIAPQLNPNDLLPTLAILPLQMETSGLDDLLGIFLADEITNTLSRSNDVNIISRLSTGCLNLRNSGLSELGRILNADFVLSGSVFRRADKAAVTIEFADAESQLVLWSDRMELAIDPLLRETDGVERIATQVRKAISLNEVRRLQSRPLHDLKLFSVLHGAVGLMHRLSPEAFALSRQYLEHVICRMPDHPAPLAWLARWHVLRAVQGWSEDAKLEAGEALKLTARALDIDPDNTLALVCEGQALVHLALRLDEAEHRYNAALDGNPNDAQGLALRGMLVSFRDRGTDGTRDTERALHLTPLDPHRFFYLALAAGACISAEDFPRAVTLAKESLRLNRTHTSTLRMLAVAHEGAGNHAEAREAADTLLRLQPDLRVSTWLRSSPSADYKVGQKFAEFLGAVGVPE